MLFISTTPPRENGIPERPQTLRYSEIKNNISLAYAQSNAERIQNRLMVSVQLMILKCINVGYRVVTYQFIIFIVFSLS